MRRDLELKNNQFETLGHLLSRIQLSKIKPLKHLGVNFEAEVLLNTNLTSMV